MLQVVTYVTNGNVTHAGNPKKTPVGAQNVPAWLTFLLAYISGVDINDALAQMEHPCCSSGVLLRSGAYSGPYININ